MKFEDVVEIIEKIAPLEYAESWDNSGVQIFSGKDNIKNIMICLEITDEIVDEALKKSVDMIITHHPLIFTSVSEIDVRKVSGKYITKLVKAGISVYSAHITFDKALKGSNWYLGKLLSLQSIEFIDNEIGIMGKLEHDMSFSDFLTHLKKSFDLPDGYIRSVGDMNDNISKVAICSGAGGNLMYRAYKEGCNVLVTGEVKLNVAQDARALGISIVDAGHYGTEKFFSENFMNLFKEIIDETSADDIELFVAQSERDPFNV